VAIETKSGASEIEVDNLVAVLPGRSEQVIVVGGHFDSWDLGQGAIDNGLGVAQLFDLARLLQAHSPINEHTVEIVWFNAEEWGLWGSIDYAERHDLTAVRAMLNLDMVGNPIAINAMGFDELVPFLESWSESLGAWDFRRKVANKTWMGSDHHPFILKGVPSITFNAPIDHEDVRYYHDFGDTFDKVDPIMLARATALVALLTHELANDTASGIRNYSQEETAELFRKAGLAERMQKAGKWPFPEEANEGIEQ
jgi:Zn-dependent M28 family amino/carboxypeptidase